ncbi:hypothetical protein ACVGVM_15620 [Pseudonocardia bannensis]|uniref:Uncharacterized protein n=1 Tax=Pseudonocardia bannensis TaxID=630973 RepID=A0A848DMV9_9PSEU|nr:hypothetical protein [Pseudonocardia bannensis]NMH94082.1 hypothetical protein [Pseudonocardia bannensis]
MFADVMGQGAASPDGRQACMTITRPTISPATIGTTSSNTITVWRFGPSR